MRVIHFLTKRERIGFICLFSLLLLLLALIIIKDKMYFNDAGTLSDAEMMLVKMQDTELNVEPETLSSDISEDLNNRTLFLFDPNTITDAEWRQLGVSERAITTIQKFKDKGGKFFKPEDLLKIYNIDKLLVNELLPYVNIKGRYNNDNSNRYKSNDFNKYKRDTTQWQRPAYVKKAYAQIYINSVDTITLKQIPGIGSALAKRIVNYRDKIGGFYDISQLSEVFGLPDSTFEKMKPWVIIDEPVKRININSERFKEIRHPYLSYKLADVIYNYRIQHGDFKKVEDIKKIYILNNETFNKIAPYLTVE